jgi:replicative DNA helicase
MAEIKNSLQIESSIKHISRAYDDTYDYILKRKSGEIKSIITPWSNLNSALMGGIEWNTINIIGARPASGKTLMANLISRESFALNPNENIAVLDLQFEMLARVSSMRELSRHLKRNMKYLNSVKSEGVITDEDVVAAKKYFDANRHKEIYIMENPQNVDNLTLMVAAFCAKANAAGTKVLVTLDHSVLVKNGSSSDSTVMKMLYELGAALTYLKKTYDVTFLVLSQLNRDIEKPERMKTPLGHYPITSDIFGADAMLQHADTVLVLNRPAKQNIKLYGPKEYEIKSDKLIVGHILKQRSGEEGLMWFNAEFHNMDILELNPSDYPKQTKNF